MKDACTHVYLNQRYMLGVSDSSYLRQEKPKSLDEQAQVQRTCNRGSLLPKDDLGKE